MGHRELNFLEVGQTGDLFGDNLSVDIPSKTGEDTKEEPLEKNPMEIALEEALLEFASLEAQIEAHFDDNQTVLDQGNKTYDDVLREINSVFFPIKIREFNLDSYDSFNTQYIKLKNTRTLLSKTNGSVALVIKK